MRFLAPFEEASEASRMGRACSICDEEKWRGMVVIDPCIHNLCEDCMTRHMEQLAARGQPITCPFCRVPVTSVTRIDHTKAGAVSPHFTRGGAVVSHVISVMNRTCEALAWALKATDPAHRPPHPVALVRPSFVEVDSTVGSATSFLEDGLVMEQVAMKERIMGASLNERRRPDGRFQCQFFHCMKMEEPGGPKFLRCSNCKVVRFCSRACQAAAWNKEGHHKRLCNLYKKHMEACAERKQRKEEEEAGEGEGGK